MRDVVNDLGFFFFFPGNVSVLGGPNVGGDGWEPKHFVNGKIRNFNVIERWELSHIYMLQFGGYEWLRFSSKIFETFTS